MVVDPLERFEEYAERLRSHGVPLRIMSHNDSEPHSSPDIRPDTWIRSMYFRDPNGIHMELAALTRPYSEADVKAIMFGNWVRFFEAALPK